MLQRVSGAGRGLALAALACFAHGVHADVFINEFHYDNLNTDSGERVEVIAPAGTSLAGWSVVLYNGSDGRRYATLPLSGTVANQCGGHGTAVVNAAGMQNGGPDGLALVNAAGGVVQFLSYEGRFTASDGPAAGQTSQDVGVAETSSTPVGHSLRLAGSGSSASSFAWQAPAASSFGACNPGQTLSGGGGGSSVLSRGVPINGLAASTGQSLAYSIEVPAGASNLQVDSSGGSGDADLYLRYASAPTTSSYSCRPYLSGNTERCSVASPQPGTWHIMLRAYTSFSGVSLLADYTPASGGGGSIPGGYYAGVNTSSASALRGSLHPVIDDHSKIPYTASTTDSWDVLEFADEDPLDPSRILDIYKNVSYAKAGGGNSFYNREHSWPKSLGFPTDGPANYPYTDLHMLMLSEINYNAARGNLPFGNCTASCTEFPTQAYAGAGGGSGSFPGNSNWSNGTIWQVWRKLKGNVARAMFYMDLRYEGGTHGASAATEPDLRLTDNLSLVTTSNGNASVAYMGSLSVLLQWHADDPVDAAERLRNDAVYSYQGNRNPFVDHPEWVACVYQNICN